METARGFQDKEEHSLEQSIQVLDDINLIEEEAETSLTPEEHQLLTVITQCLKLIIVHKHNLRFFSVTLIKK